MIAIHVLAFLLGLGVVVGTLLSAIRTFVLPRSAPDVLTRLVFVGMRRIFDFWMRWVHSYLERDAIMAFFAPIAVLTLLPTWLVLVLVGYTAMFWALGALAFFRSPRPGRSWITAAGAVLDAAALTASTLDVPPDPRADLCIRAGYLALRYIADYFGIPYHPDPHYPDEPISIHRGEFDAACDLLAEGGVSLKADRDQAWRDFAGWRVTYDAVLLALCTLTRAPWAPWSSDRAPKFQTPSLPPPPAGTQGFTFSS